MSLDRTTAAQIAAAAEALAERWPRLWTADLAGELHELRSADVILMAMVALGAAEEAAP